jgi:hypothetical protein
MVPVEAAVNSSMLLTIHCSMERLSRLVAGVVRNPARIRQHQPFGGATQ